MNIKDIDNSIFKLDKKEEPGFVPEQVSQRKEIGYAYDGHKEKVVDAENAVAYAKEVNINGRNKYYVKLCKIGRNAGKLPNPNDILFSKNETEAKIGGINVYSWHSVDKKVFDDYKMFLSNGENRCLRAAQNRLQS